MIAGLIGNIYRKDSYKVLFNVNGVIYEVFMSLNSLSKIKEQDSLLITQIFREDGVFLYGFLDLGEKNLFDTLIKINGIGPKVAIAICSYFDAQSFISIINSNNFSELKKVPGIGEKMAKRIIVEVSGKLIAQDTQYLPNHKQEAVAALEVLGFKIEHILKVLEKIDSTNTQDIIKSALKSLKS